MYFLGSDILFLHVDILFLYIDVLLLCEYIFLKQIAYKFFYKPNILLHLIQYA